MYREWKETVGVGIKCPFFHATGTRGLLFMTYICALLEVYYERKCQVLCIVEINFFSDPICKLDTFPRPYNTETAPVEFSCFQFILWGFQRLNKLFIFTRLRLKKYLFERLALTVVFLRYVLQECLAVLAYTLGTAHNEFD